MDGKDDANDHYLLYLNDMPVGVSRVRFENNIAKIERVGILNEYQGHGYGRLMMKAILSDLQQDARVKTVKLSAQVQAISFYEKLGFIICGEKLMNVGIPHKTMVMNIA